MRYITSTIIVTIALLLSACVSSQPEKCDKYYFMVMSCIYDASIDQKEVILSGVAELNKPFAFHDTYKHANGILSKEQNNLIHFKGSVQIATMSASFDTDLTVGVGHSPKMYAFSGAIAEPFYIQIKPLPDTLQNVLRMSEDSSKQNHRTETPTNP